MRGAELSNRLQLATRLRALGAHALALLLPDRCLLCGLQPADEGLCAGCRMQLEPPGEACPVCARPGTAGRVCGACLRRPPAFDASHAACVYCFPAPGLVQGFKYGARFAHLRPMLSLMRALPPPEADLLMPMPLFRARLRERGFNQALELARPLARAWGLPLVLDAAWRIRDTGHQTGRGQAERFAAMRGAFDCDPRLAGLRVAVIDDVMTTGASLDALARALKAAGVVRVECRVFARTLFDD